MLSTRLSLRAVTGIATLAFALPAAAQTAELPPLPELPPMGDSTIVTTTINAPTLKTPMAQAEVDTLPTEYRRLPVDEEILTTTVGDDGVETITRTRRILNRAPVEATTYQTTASYYETAPVDERARYTPTYANQTYTQPAYRGSAYSATAYPAAGPAAGYAPMVLDRQSWIDECERRTDGRDKDETGSIIGGLLGAIGGGVLGNRLWNSERLAGTLIGGGVGGIAGLLIGSLFNGDNEDDRYDCEAALSTYLDQYGQNGARFASRVISASAPVVYQGYPAYSYAQAPAYYQPQPTMVMVPVTTYQQQRVIVRESVREEIVPGATRNVPRPVPAPQPAPAPSPKMIKQAPAPVYAPAPTPKMIKN